MLDGPVGKENHSMLLDLLQDVLSIIFYYGTNMEKQGAPVF